MEFCYVFRCSSALASLVLVAMFYCWIGFVLRYVCLLLNAADTFRMCPWGMSISRRNVTGKSKQLLHQSSVCDVVSSILCLLYNQLCSEWIHGCNSSVHQIRINYGQGLHERNFFNSHLFNSYYIATMLMHMHKTLCGCAWCNNLSLCHLRFLFLPQDCLWEP